MPLGNELWLRAIPHSTTYPTYHFADQTYPIPIIDLSCPDPPNLLKTLKPTYHEPIIFRAKK